MRAFEIYLNNAKLCLAGTVEGVFSTIISSVTSHGRDELTLHVGGLDSTTLEQLKWKESDLCAGDEIRIKIIESTKIDEPHRTKDDPQKVFESKKNYVREMAKQLGWQLEENREIRTKK